MRQQKVIYFDFKIKHNGTHKVPPFFEIQLVKAMKKLKNKKGRHF